MEQIAIVRPQVVACEVCNGNVNPVLGTEINLYILTEIMYSIACATIYVRIPAAVSTGIRTAATILFSHFVRLAFAAINNYNDTLSTYTYLL